ncbi:MAG: hypothetical protein DRN04_04815 [Thermoprotei archaeon]|nr:MAG: hypothetical protein DRN04_04815 [Thermoprotei archaeon]
MECNRLLVIKAFCRNEKEPRAYLVLKRLKQSACVPGNAIYPEPKILSDGRKQYINYTKCVVAFSKTLGCRVCIKECSFLKETSRK